MAKDIKEELKKIDTLSSEKLAKGHEDRFLSKLDKKIPEQRKSSFNWMQLVASLIVFLGIGYGIKNYTSVSNNTDEVITNTTPTKKQPSSLSAISPDFKKIEDYYLSAINLELSKVKLTPENKELFDAYIKRLEELKKEYTQLSMELANEGPNELTINALINNLKRRLNLLYRLKEQLKEIKNSGALEA